MIRIGAHVSASGDPASVAQYALSVGCECAQIFAKSPRQWAAAPLTAERASVVADAFRRLGVKPLYTHTAYLLNLSTTDDGLRRKSVAALVDELERARLLGAEAVVTHVGTAPDGDIVTGIARLAESISAALRVSPHAPTLLLENSAGSGKSVGGSFAHLARAIHLMGSRGDRVGICLDTCHAWAQGYAVSRASGFRRIVTEIESNHPRGRVGLIHANDCKAERGSHTDRHEWIGKGHIGEAGFKAIFREPGLSDCSIITEMPGAIPEKDEVNLGLLKSYRTDVPGV